MPLLLVMEQYPPQHLAPVPVKAFTINDVFPWGRSFHEYQKMFRLTTTDLEGRILGCADGPAAFNAEMSRRGYRVVSIDPLYQFDATQIRARIDATYSAIIGSVLRDRHRFVWDVVRTPEMLGELRMAAMNEFLSDYEDGRRSGRYLAEALPRLSFADRSFDLALCSHFLFLYSDEVSCEDHIHGILELCRVAREVRVFPLLDMHGKHSRHVQPVIEALATRGLQARVETVAYEFQRGGHEMLKIARSAPSDA